MNVSSFKIPLCLVLALFCTLSACELIVIKDSATKKSVIPRDQTSPQGVVYVFKQEIDSSNVQAAIKLMASDDERPLLAIEKLELQEEIARLGRMIAKKDITLMHVDTLSPVRQRLRTEFGYLRELTFMTVRVDSLWYISKVLEK
ncbi:MAG: hypothetical protein MUF71_21055 [Candidatus Kapabacteria bacterium]|jgi:hypothetical protein|nr:hypothetical protein [Candidatus Kapabacteria bacterium]